MEQVQQPKPQSIQPDSLRPACAECDAFDQKTRELMSELFSTEEMSTISMMLAGTIHMRRKKMMTTSMSDQGRIMEQVMMDKMGATLGKFMIAFHPTYRKAVIQSMRSAGIALKMNHEACPHAKATAKTEGAPENGTA